MPFIGNKPSAVPLTSADIADGIITSAKIVDATIANADIANSTINLTTKVTGTLPVANGGTGLAALGTSLQVLRTNSGATALEFASSSSDFVKLATGTISSSTASISFDGYFTSDYNIYKFFWYDCRTATNNGSRFALRYRRSNADVTASNYKAIEVQWVVLIIVLVDQVVVIQVTGTLHTWVCMIQHGIFQIKILVFVEI